MIKFMLRDWKRATGYGCIELPCAPLLGWRIEVSNSLDERAVYIVREAPIVHALASPGSMMVQHIVVPVQRMK